MSEPIHRVQSPKHLAWLDLEMTGLDASSDVILQAALIVTDAELRPLEELACDVWQPEAALANMTPFVRAMHEKTGLLARVRATQLELRDAEKQLLERLAGWGAFPAILCGNSIGNDRRFVDRWMPGFAAYLHYRMIDVSALKVLAGLWWGEAAVYQKSEDAKHDALNDVRLSIAELRHYRDTLMKK